MPHESNGPPYQILNIQEVPDLTPDGTFRRLARVTYRVDGVQSTFTFEVPKDQLNTEAFWDGLHAEVANIRAVMGLE